MNQRNQGSRDDADVFFDDAGSSGTTSHGIHLQSLLRGRYHWAIILGLILGTCGALAGYFSQGDVYTSSSLVSIDPIAEGIFGEDYDSISKNYDSWISLQLTKIEGPSVLESAMKSDAWQSAAFGPYRTSEVLFANGLKLNHSRGQQVIEISYQAPVPELAQVGVNAITQAYMEELERSEQRSDSHVLGVLEKQRQDLQRKIQKLNTDKRSLSTEYNEYTIKEDLDRMSALRDALEQDLTDTRLQLSELGVETGDDVSPQNYTVEQLAAQNPQLAQMIKSRDQIASDIAYKKRLGRGDRHPEMKEANAALDTLNADIEQLVREMRGSMDGSWLPDSDQDDETLSPVAKLRAQEKRLVKKFEDAKARAQHLAMIYGELQTIANDLKRHEDDLARTINRIENLRIESEAPARATIQSEGGLPSKPSNKGKRKQLAALGGMAGLCGGFGLVILVGLMDRRLRHIEDAQVGLGGCRMLGVLPELPDEMTDPEQAVMASHCVHHVRTLLQLGRKTDGYILAVTGPAAGSGKTSLTMALGMSFASSGSRTLLIDCDIVGGGLTRRMLPESTDKYSGVLEACNGTAFGDCIVNTNIKNLDMLPIGSALPSQAGNLSPSAVKKLLAKARDEYENVIVDTGPVLGSLEASMVTAQADKTVVIVSRGDQKPIIIKSLEHLRSIGADITGIVFNHADAVDIERSTYASVTVSQNRRQDDRELSEVKWIDQTTSDRYGPLATAMASYGQMHGHTEHHEE